MSESTAQVLRPMPDKMSEFLPLKSRRDAHIAARDAATQRLHALAQEDAVPKARLKELEDEVELHKAAIVATEAEMRTLQYVAQD